ncbi:MltF family protein [Pseudochryseolinea flava]|uniref:Lytic transglycosylase F n=1 Tax=Pseudochryseolinea flava TaxID=2059302 RepID=A0A364Y6J1_9BACT|nr:transporter substrate-binding domain-containing protein [Pseudochryseolinea flava]RAW02714.1 lytic transglycosylase F [Pseudochryseolinea flava]
MVALSRNLSLVAVLLLFGFSCNPSQNKTFVSNPRVELDLDAIQKRGFINVLVDNNSISYFIYKGQPMGYEYELLTLLADELDVELRIKVTSGVEHAIDQLNRGEGDLLAFPLTVTKNRTDFVSFTKPHYNSFQVLVQRKPDGWRKMNEDQINEGLIRNPVDLVGKKVSVITGTSYEQRLRNLSEEIGGDIDIELDTLNAESESLIRRVAMGDIEYTVSDHTIARVNASYYPNIDVSTVLSVAQQIAWAVRKNSPLLLKATNTWLTRVKKQPTFMVIYNRYFKSPRTSVMRMNSDYSSLGGNKLSPYDDLIRDGAAQLNWDWRLLASVVYQESKFVPDDESWAGAKGLMQLMPETARQYGVKDIHDPVQNIKAGVKYLKYLDKFWSKSVADPNERLKFILASYNVGLSHIIDAKKLAAKYGKDSTRWNGNVEYYLLKKSDPQYYRDPLAKTGYCKCEEPVNYVRHVLSRYDEYKVHIRDSVDQLSVETVVTAR